LRVNLKNIEDSQNLKNSMRENEYREKNYQNEESGLKISQNMINVLKTNLLSLEKQKIVKIFEIEFRRRNFGNEEKIKKSEKGRFK
jgi:hypothetical protein